MAHIKTVYRVDGSIQRQPVGYGGGLCHEATKPYEKRNLGNIKKTPTDEACDPPAVATTHEEQREELRA